MKRLTNKIIRMTIVANSLIRLKHYKHLISSRHALAKLNDDMLKDIGLTKAEAEREAAKPFWKSDIVLSFDQTIHNKQLNQDRAFTDIQSKAKLKTG